MKDTPLFSVLIANFNNGKYVMDAIESVRNQTYTNWEIILVDDGSVDNSHDLYEQLEQDSRIHIFFNEVNKGCGYTKRRCVELANGEICGFLDSDDVLLPEALEIHVNIHLERQEVSCVFSRYYICDEHLNTIGELRSLHIPAGQTYFSNREYSPEHFASFKRNYYFRTKGIDASLLAAVDQDLYFKLEEVAPIAIIDRFTYKYRLLNNTLSHGENLQKAYYWNLVVRHETCLRRGLEVMEYSYKDFCDCLRDARESGMEFARGQIRLTRSYRLGYAILHPINGLKRVLKISK